MTFTRNQKTWSIKCYLYKDGMRPNLRRNHKLSKEIWNKRLRNQIRDCMNHQKELILKLQNIPNKDQSQYHHKTRQSTRMEYCLQLSR